MCDDNPMPCEEQTLQEEAPHEKDALENEVLEDEAIKTLGDVVSSSLPPFPNVPDDVGINEDNDELSYSLDDVGVAHDD